MSTQFRTVEEAKGYAAYCAGVNVADFKEVSELKVGDMGSMLLDDPDTSDEVKKSIRDQIAAQVGFEFLNGKGQKVQIVIGPFREGFDLWLINPENGMAWRV